MAKKRKAKQSTKQSVVRYHSDWMRLIERSGPFLSLPVLLDTFPQGPSADDRDRRVQLKQAYESWQAENRDIAVHRAWIEYVLTHGLEIPADHLVDTGHIPQNLSVRVDVHHETLTPDIALIEPEDNTPATPRMLVMIVPPDQALDKKLPDKNWVASPQTRMSDLVRGCNDQGITFGLLTNGEQWMLVYSKQGETASFTTWYASIWFDEKITLRAFRDLLSARRFYGDPDRTLDKLFERSADDQHEVTDQLGLQVRDAIETLVSAIDEIDRNRKKKLLAGFSEEQLYEACVTVMMRLVFLFFAEERRLLPVKESFYEQNYSLHGLFDQLQSQKISGEEILELERSGWCRLLALFRAIHGGVQHDDMQLHAYGSSLFDPDRFPFLEGRPQDTKWRELESQPLPINDRTLLHVLEALKLLEVRGIGGGQRITRVMSFRELDVEDIGHIYESLLDHTAKRAKGHVLGIVGSKGKEPELALRCLGEAAEQSREDLVEYLKAETGKTAKAIEKLLDAEIKIDKSRLLAACGNDQDFLAQVKPFANLVRENRSGDPIIIPDGSVYVTEGTDRRSSGTHYTPKSLTEPIVQYTLEPLVYEGPAEGKPQDEWKLKTPAEILELNICDMACGSGAFLVQACRYMAERLVEAWEHIEQTTEAPADDSKTDTGNTVVGSVEAVEMVVETNTQYATNKTARRPRITPLGELSKNDPSEELIPLDPAERMVYARRIVADRCLYGVDKNPLAVEMAKLSLWLLTLAMGKPFTFLNHAIRQGDSLVGVCRLDQLLKYTMLEGVKVRPLFAKQKEQIERRVNALQLLRNQIESLPSSSMQAIEEKQIMMGNVESQTHRLNYAADRLLCCSYRPMKIDERETVLNETIGDVVYKFRDVEVLELNKEAATFLDENEIDGRFHWPLEFPEVFAKGGFDAFICNPPFLWALRISIRISIGFSHFLKVQWPHAKKNADLCSYFLLRAASLLRNGGTMGFIATNTISEADTKETTLDHMVGNGEVIYRATSSLRWPGAANVRASVVHIAKQGWNGMKVLDEVPAPQISTSLEPFVLEGSANPLQENEKKCFKGSVPLGDGFFLADDEVSDILSVNKKYEKVIFPYLNGQELNDSPTFEPGRNVIYFSDWKLEQCDQFPECLQLVRERVKPVRDKIKPTNNMARQRKELWWKFTGPTVELYDAISNFDQVLVASAVSKHHAFAFVPANYIYSNALNVFAFDSFGAFALLQSSIHANWALAMGSKLEDRPRYNVTDCFETFPFPIEFATLDAIGKKYHNLRSEIMASNEEGLTKTYNRFHSDTEKGTAISQLRLLQKEMDENVCSVYGIAADMKHGFVETPLGTRFTISELARREIIQTLITINLERGNPTISAKPKRTRKKKAAAGLLFDDEG